MRLDVLDGQKFKKISISLIFLNTINFKNIIFKLHQ